MVQILALWQICFKGPCAEVKFSFKYVFYGTVASRWCMSQYSQGGHFRGGMRDELGTMSPGSLLRR